MKVVAHSPAISDHAPITIELKLEIKKNAWSNEPKFKVCVLKSKEKNFKKSIHRKMNTMLQKINHQITRELLNLNDVHKLNTISEWLLIMHTFTWKMAAVEAFGITKMTSKTHQSFDTKLLNLEKEISQLKLQKDRDANKMKKLLQAKTTREREIFHDYWDSIINKIKKLGPEKVLVAEMKKLNTTNKPKLIKLKTATGILSTEPAIVGKTFHDHFYNILNDQHLEPDNTQCPIKEEYNIMLNENKTGPKILNKP